MHYLRARLALAHDDAPAAVEELRLALAHDESSAHLHVAYAEALSRAGDRERAEAEARRAVSLAEGGPTEPRARMALAEALARRERLDDAAAELALAVRAEVARAHGGGAEVDPEPWRLLARVDLARSDAAAAERAVDALAAFDLAASAAGLREVAQWRAERHDGEAAERLLRRAIERAPSDGDALKMLARVIEPRRRAESRALLERAAAADPNDVDALLALGRLALADGDAGAARAWLRQVLAVDADEGGARVRVASTFLEAHRPADALDALGDGERGGQVAFLRGVALQRLRRYGEAAAAYRAVPSSEADLYLSARANLAWCLSFAGKHSAASRALEQPLAAHPDDLRLVTTGAVVLQRAGRAAEAVELVRRALPSHEEDGSAVAELYDALATSLEKAGRRGEALAALEKLAASRPRDPAILFTLGSAYDRAGERDAALARMNAAIEADPQHAPALNFVAYLYAERGERLDEAQRLIERALAVDPDNGFYLDSLGWVLFRKGDAARALTALERADALAGPDSTILEHLGDVYRSAKRPADAAAAYRRALKSVEGTGESDPAVQRAALERKLRDVAPRSAQRPTARR